MRLLVGIEVDGRVTEMSLPDSVALAHLVPEVLAAVGADGESRKPRRVDGEWFDLERSLGQQACVSGSLICFEDRVVSEIVHRHDPVSVVADRGPPVDLVSDGSAAVALGGCAGAVLAAGSPSAAAVVLALTPVLWSALPLVAGAAEAAGLRVRELAAGVSAWAGGVALAASGAVALRGSLGLCLDGCLALSVLSHVGRRRSAAALVRISLGALEWCSLGAILPLALVVAGWSGW